jgi:hypothetical protein
VTLRRLDLAAEIYHIREPQKIPLVMSRDETRRSTGLVLPCRLQWKLARLATNMIDGPPRLYLAFLRAPTAELVDAKGLIPLLQ